MQSPMSFVSPELPVADRSSFARRSSGLSSSTPSKKRLMKACEGCRVRKIKCSGHQPCEACTRSNIQCIIRSQARPRRRKKASVLHPLASIYSLAQEKQARRPLLPFRQVEQDHLFNNPALFKLQSELRQGCQIPGPGAGVFRFYGPSSHFAFVRRARQQLNQQQESVGLDHSIREKMNNWDFESFIFSRNTTMAGLDAFLGQERGLQMIQAYHKLIHPQVPVLSHEKTLQVWESCFAIPALDQNESSMGRRLMLIVLAIGARVLISAEPCDAHFLDRWSIILAHKAKEGYNIFEDICLESVQFCLLLGVYAEQTMKIDEAYLYLGHAARCAMTIGLNRLQVIQYSQGAPHDLLVTFWTLYIHERNAALIVGRPSAFQDSQIDCSLPEGVGQLAETDHFPQGIQSSAKQLAWLRAMVELARVADKILGFLSSPRTVGNSSAFARMLREIQQCEAILEGVTTRLPAYLHFFDSSVPVGAPWQEVQRAHLGFTYYLMRILVHRPALIWITMIESKEAAHRHAGSSINLETAVLSTIQSSQDLLALASNVYFTRFPDIAKDGKMVTYIVYACITVLFHVLDSGTDVDQARSAFQHVEIGIRCLDQVVNLGTTTGKLLSMEIMDATKQVWAAAGHNITGVGDFIDTFPWLQENLDEACLQLGNGLLSSNFSYFQESLLSSIFGSHNQGPHKNH